MPYVLKLKDKYPIKVKCCSILHCGVCALCLFSSFWTWPAVRVFRAWNREQITSWSSSWQVTMLTLFISRVSLYLQRKCDWRAQHSSILFQMNLGTFSWLGFDSPSQWTTTSLIDFFSPSYGFMPSIHCSFTGLHTMKGNDALGTVLMKFYPPHGLARRALPVEVGSSTSPWSLLVSHVGTFQPFFPSSWIFLRPSCGF